jgi:hypothetical protein
MAVLKGMATLMNGEYSGWFILVSFEFGLPIDEARVCCWAWLCACVLVELW